MGYSEILHVLLPSLQVVPMLRPRIGRPFRQILEESYSLYIIRFRHGKTMIHPSRQDVQVTLFEENTDPSLAFVTNLFMSLAIRETDIGITLTINDITNLFVNVKMLIVEDLQRVIIRRSVITLR
jgi:hypothetical protein